MLTGKSMAADDIGDGPIRHVGVGNVRTGDVCLGQIDPHTDGVTQIRMTQVDFVHPGLA